MSEDEVLPDVLAIGLKVIFCGTAAGNVSAATQSYYAHPQNQFWRTLACVGFTPHQLQPSAYRELLSYGFGLTDLAKHHAGMDHALPQAGFDPAVFRAKMHHYQPHYVAFTSKKTGHVYFKHPVTYGLQAESLGSTHFFILPSPSPAARGVWNETYWQELADLVRII
jgi:TDG/mug DNA glycosylase family protein